MTPVPLPPLHNMLAANDSRRLRVLLIDDDEVIVSSLRHPLATQDADLETATDPESALDRLSAGDSGVVVIDPYLTGASRPPSFTTGSDSQPSFKGQHQ